MRLTLDALQVLDSIDRRGSFAAAAEELHRVPSAITYSVQQLEEALGILLFDRRGHRAKLTDAGRELLGEGRHLLRAAADLECRVRQVAKGWEAELRIAVSTLIGIEKLYGIVAESYEANTGTRLKFLLEVLKNGLYDEFFTDVKTCLIPFQDPERYGRSILENSSFLVSSVFYDPALG